MDSQFAGLGGIPIRVDKHLSRWEYESVQVRFPKSKKRRIRKKWAKRPENFQTVKKPTFAIFQIGWQFVMSPESFEALKGQLDRLTAAQLGIPADRMKVFDNNNYAAARMGEFSFPGNGSSI